MPVFRCKALSSAGENLIGQMQAASSEEAIARLQEQGHLPMKAMHSGASVEESSFASDQTFQIATT